MIVDPWNSLQYRRMDRADYQAGRLHVRFANGDEVDVEGACLVPVGTQSPDWAQMSCDGVELEVPTQAGPHYIFWETIRELTDQAYANRLEQSDATYRIQTGQQIKKLRECRGMTGKDVAARAGINNRSLSRIEHGKRGVTLTTLRRILDALGCSLQDMVLDTAENEEQATEVARGLR